MVVEEADGGTAPYDPVPIILMTTSAPIPHCRTLVCPSLIRTSRLVTGLSSNERCVSREKFRSGSRSASSAKLLEVRVRVVRLGREVASVDWMLLSLLRARRRGRRRGERGKLERAVMSLSVKSMASWSYILRLFSGVVLSTVS